MPGITVKSRPLASGAVSWSLWIRPKPVDGKSLIPLPQFSKPTDRPAVEAIAATYRKALKKGLAEPQPETVAEYFERWNEVRALKYPKQAASDESVFRLWLAERLGKLPIRGVSREHLIELSHQLDVIAAKGEAFGEKRARNIFSVVAAMFRDAHQSKDRMLRVLEANPMADVPWPERGTTRALKQLIYPAEFSALVSCPDVPVVRARLYAVTLYTTTRAAEVRVLDCAHVDLTHGSVQILVSDDPTARKATGIAATKSTKSGKARLTSLEPTLAPLLSAMVAERGGVGRLFPERPNDTPKGNQWRPASTEYIPGPDGAYGVCGTFKRDLRAALKWAGIAERPELFDDTDRRRSLSIRFHDLRASGITWRHARRDNPAAILQECGHEDQATNAIYIRALRGLALADLFPVLPERVNGVNRNSRNTGKFVGAEGFEDATNPCKIGSVAIECAHPRPTETRNDGLDPGRSLAVAALGLLRAGLAVEALVLLERLVAVLEAEAQDRLR